ncbi:MAG: ribonuclease J [Armatimonadetes bacterium]|nr:ribonuclease J [Armatimonadota bacterium]MBX3108765.1 ribonuclease J [Fimbriimonadaceae bacterium]
MSLFKIIPLGGTGEIGKNCTVVESADDIVVVDCGISFPHEEHYGVDIVIPDFTYLLENREKVRGIVLTHAHEDHVGALSYLLTELNVPLYCSPLTEALVGMKLEERARNIEPKFVRMTPGEKFKLGGFEIEPVRVTHSIPETSAIAFHTSEGVILFTADFKFDKAPVDKLLSDESRLKELGEEGVLLLLCDTTNVDRPGWSNSESEVGPSLKEIFSAAESRVFVTQFSSNIHRMQQICDSAKAAGRKVSIAGRRMEQTFNLCRRLGYLNVAREDTVPIEDSTKLPNDQVVIIVTGSQGEPNAALSQMSRREYNRVKVRKGDTIVYSARPIPGNEGGIWRVVNNLIRQGAMVITDYPTPVHTSGHASQDEIKQMYELTKPFYFAPVHGEPRHQRKMADLLVEWGHAPHRIYTLENGQTLNIGPESAWVEEGAPFGEVFIDQNSHVPVAESVLRHRHTLAHDGVFVITVVVDRQHGELATRPRADVRGLNAEAGAVEDVMDDLSSILAKLSPSELTVPDYLSAQILEASGKLIWRSTRQRPLVIPIVELI